MAEWSATRQHRSVAPRLALALSLVTVVVAVGPPDRSPSVSAAGEALVTFVVPGLRAEVDEPPLELTVRSAVGDLGEVVIESLTRLAPIGIATRPDADYAHNHDHRQQKPHGRRF